MATDCPHHSYHCTPEIINMRKSQAWQRLISCSLFICHISRPRPLCPLSFSFHRLSSNLNFNQSGYKYGACSLALGLASLLSTAVCLATSALLTLGLSNAHFSFPWLSIRLQVCCSLSTSPTRISPFRRYLSCYRYISCSLPLRRASLLSAATCPAIGALLALCLSDAHLSFLPLFVRLQVHCLFFTSLMPISPSHR